MNTFASILERYDALSREVSELSFGAATLVLASKTVPQDVLMRLSEVRPGVIYGENKVQELLSKYYESLDVTWQFIGRLQTNKVKYIVDKVSMIQSVDSLRLAEEIEKRLAKIDKTMDILIEVNIGQEESKGGVQLGDLDGLIDKVLTMPHLRFKGLMSVLPNTDEGALVPLYKELKDVFLRVQKIYGEDVTYLSAGMSGDYALALQNGSNMVRIGSAVFGERHYDQ